MKLAISDDDPVISPISPLREVGAYEALWLEQGATFKTLAERFAKDKTALPSDIVTPARSASCADEVLKKMKARGVHRFGCAY